MSTVVTAQITVSDAQSFSNYLFSGLTASTAGSAILCTDTGDITITNSTFSSNPALNAGGAIFCEGVATVSYTSFNSNSAVYGGAFCYAGTYTADLLDVTMKQNTAEYGGGLYNAGMVFLEGVSFSSNAATASGGGVYNLGIETCTECQFTANSAPYGGAFSNLGILTAKNNNFKSNKGDLGGALYNAEGADLGISGCTFTNNVATMYGGAVSNFGGQTEIESSSMTGNIATDGGAIFNYSALLSMTGSTMSNNSGTYGAGAFNYNGLLALTNSMISGNTASTGGGFYGESGTVAISGCVFAGNVAENGGAGTDYFSDLIINGSTFTQNVGSVQGGALSYGGSTSCMTASDSVFSQNLSMYGGAMFLEYSTVELNSLSVLDNAATFSGGGVYNMADLYVQNSDFERNIANYGGVIANFGAITLTGSTFNNNLAMMQGAVLYNYNAVFVVDSANFAHNTAGQFGGVIYQEGTASGIVTNSRFEENLSYHGGAIINYSNLSLEQSEFKGNVAVGDAGAIFNLGGELTLNGVTMSGNTASGAAGALYTTGTYSISINDGAFDSNIAIYGGALMVENEIVDISGTTFENNAATVSGGVLYNTGTVSFNGASIRGNQGGYGGAVMNVGQGLVTIENSNASGNTATAYGGVVCNSAEVVLKNSTFADNFASVGGAIRCDGTSSMSDQGSLFENNTADFGAALYNEGEIELIDTVLKANHATVSGGGIYNEGTFHGSSLTFESNVAQYGVFFNDGTATILGSTFSKNNTNFGGAVYNCGTATELTLDNVYFDQNDAIYGGAIYNESMMTLGNATFSNNFGFTGGAICNTGVITVTGKIVLMSAYDTIYNANYIIVDSSKFDLSSGYALVVDGSKTGWRAGYRFYATDGYGFAEVGSNGYLVPLTSQVKLDSSWSERNFGEVIAEGTTYGINAFSTADGAAGALTSGGTITNSGGKAVFSNEIYNLTMNGDAYISGSNLFVDSANISGVIYCTDGSAGTASRSNRIEVTGSTAKRIFLGENVNDIVQKGSTATIIANISGSTFANGIFCGGDAANATILMNSTLIGKDSVAGLVIGGVNTKGTDHDHCSTVTLYGTREINLSGMTCANYVCGGSLIGSYSSEISTGSITLVVSSGTYNQIVGGSLIQASADVSSEIIGDISITIGSDVSCDFVFGGCTALKNGPTRNETVTGNISIVLDVSSGACASGATIVCGGGGYAFVDGNATVTVKGAGNGNDFMGARVITCDSSNAKWGDELHKYRFVSGDRTLKFTNFTGTIMSNILFVDTVNIDATSEVVFTYLNSRLDGINWNISADSVDRVSVNLAESDLGVFSIDMSGSILDLNCEIDDAEEWTVFKTADNSVLENLASAEISLNGDQLSQVEDFLFCGDLYQLEYREDGALVASKLAV